jgi:excisionase family DNA binding protein
MKETTPSQEITVPELAKCLQCSIPRAQTLVRTGRIPGHKTSRGWVTTRQAIDKYLADRSRGNTTSRSSSSR